MIRRIFGVPLSALIPALSWTAVVLLLLSSDLASAAGTSRIIVPLLQALFPHGSPETIALIHGLLRKTAHVVEYLILGFLWSRALSERPPAAARLPTAAWATFIAILVASLDEGNQTLLSSRTGSIVDVGIDAIGAVVGAFGGARGFWRRPSRKSGSHK